MDPVDAPLDRLKVLNWALSIDTESDVLPSRPPVEMCNRCVACDPSTA